MRFLPRAPASLQPALAEAFRHLDLPEPVRVCLLRPPGATACYQVDDAEGGTHRLTILLADLDGTGVNGTLVAARRFEEVADLPVPHAVALPLGLLGCSAYLQRLPEGRPADTLGDADRALTALGRVLDGLGGQSPGRSRARGQPVRLSRHRGLGVRVALAVPAVGRCGATRGDGLAAAVGHAPRRDRRRVPRRGWTSGAGAAGPGAGRGVARR